VSTGWWLGRALPSYTQLGTELGTVAEDAQAAELQLATAYQQPPTPRSSPPHHNGPPANALCSQEADRLLDAHDLRAAAYLPVALSVSAAHKAHVQGVVRPEQQSRKQAS